MRHQFVMKKIFSLLRRKRTQIGYGHLDLEMIMDRSESVPLECKLICFLFCASLTLF